MGSRSSEKHEGDRLAQCEEQHCVQGQGKLSPALMYNGQVPLEMPKAQQQEREEQMD